MVLDEVSVEKMPSLFKRYIAEFGDVVLGRTSFRLYLVANFPNILGNKLGVNWHKRYKWRGKEIYEPDFAIPKLPEPTFYRCLFDILVGQYSIPECHVKKNDIVIDCGAHIGSFTYIAAKKYGAKKVFAFEPLSINYKILIQNINKWKLSNVVVPIRRAVYSQDNIELDIYYDPNLIAISSISKEFTKLIKLNNSEKIKSITIDTFVKENKLSKIDFVKMDIEGSEREAIKGAKKTIRKFKPRMVISGYHLPDDTSVIPDLVLNIREDYKFKIVKDYETDIFFW